MSDELNVNLPFNAAYKDDSEELIRAFRLGVDFSKCHPRSGHTPLQAACEVNALGAIKTLLEKIGVDPNARFTKVSRVDGHVICGNCTALMEVRSVEAASILLSFGADSSLLDENGLSASDYAEERGLLDVKDLLSRTK